MVTRYRSGSLAFYIDTFTFAAYVVWGRDLIGGGSGCPSLLVCFLIRHTLSDRLR